MNILATVKCTLQELKYKIDEAIQFGMELYNIHCYRKLYNRTVDYL